MSAAAAAAAPAPVQGRDLATRVQSVDWYHTIDLGNGIVTPGVFDHRPFLSEYKLPESLKGKRVLDAASMDGFWAFELERRGAAEVVAVDIESFAEADLPPAARAAIGEDALRARKTKTAFHIAQEALGSKVQVKYVNLYELSPEKVGKFDFVFMSDVLLHLQNPMKALQNLCKVTGGEAHLSEVYYPVFPDRLALYEGGRKDCVWWSFGLGALQQMISDAGFSSVELLNKFVLTGPSADFPPMHHAIFRAKP